VDITYSSNQQQKTAYKYMPKINTNISTNTITTEQNVTTTPTISYKKLYPFETKIVNTQKKYYRKNK